MLSNFFPNILAFVR